MRNRFIQFGFGILFFVFLCSYFVERNGYYEYHLSQNKNLTDSQIKRFEEDVKEGKDIDINSYLENQQADYSNHLTRKTSEVSLKINDYLNKIFRDVFGVLERFIK